MFRIVAISHRDIDPVVFELPMVRLPEWPDFSDRAALIRKDPEKNDVSGSKKIVGLTTAKPKKRTASSAPFVASRAQRRQSAAILSLGTHNAELTIYECHYLGYEQTPLAMNETHSYNRTSNSAMLPLIKMLTRHYPIAKIEERNFLFSWENMTYMDRKVFIKLLQEPAFSQRFSVHALPLLDADITSHFWQAMAVCKSARDTGLCIAEQLIVFPIANRIVGIFAYKTGFQKPVIGSYSSKLGLGPPTRLAVGKELLRLKRRVNADSPTISLADMINEFAVAPRIQAPTRYKGISPKTGRPKYRMAMVLRNLVLKRMWVRSQQYPVVNLSLTPSSLERTGSKNYGLDLAKNWRLKGSLL